MENVSTVILITFAIVIGLMIIGMVFVLMKKLLEVRSRQRQPFTNEIVTSNPL
jgi:hypothetical protein